MPRLQNDQERLAWRRIHTRWRNLLLPGLRGRNRLHVIDLGNLGAEWWNTISLVAYPRDFAFYIADPMCSIHRLSSLRRCGSFARRVLSCSSFAVKSRGPPSAQRHKFVTNYDPYVEAILFGRLRTEQPSLGNCRPSSHRSAAACRFER